MTSDVREESSVVDKKYVDEFTRISNEAYMEYIKLHGKEIQLITFNITNNEKQHNLTIVFRLNNFELSHDRLHVIVRFDLSPKKAFVRSDLFLVDDKVLTLNGMGAEEYRERITEIIKSKKHKMLKEIFSAFYLLSPSQFASHMKDCIGFEEFKGMGISQEYGATAHLMGRLDNRLIKKSQTFRNKYGREIRCASCERKISNPQVIYREDYYELKNKKTYKPNGKLPNLDSVVFKNVPSVDGEPVYMAKVRSFGRFMFTCDMCHPKRATEARKRRREERESREKSGDVKKYAS